MSPSCNPVQEARPFPLLFLSCTYRQSPLTDSSLFLFKQANTHMHTSALLKCCNTTEYPGVPWVLARQVNNNTNQLCLFKMYCILTIQLPDPSKPPLAITNPISHGNWTVFPFPHSSHTSLLLLCTGFSPILSLNFPPPCAQAQTWSAYCLQGLKLKFSHDTKSEWKAQKEH